MLKIKQIEDAVGLPTDKWHGNCFGIACAILKAGLVDGNSIYGHYLGPINPLGYWHMKAGLPFVHHGWILLEDEHIMDPTRWSFLNVDPYVAVFNPDDEAYQEYDDGGDNFRIAMRQTCPEAKDGDKFVSMDVDSRTADFVNFLLDGKATHDNLTQSQLMWIANAPYSQLGLYVVSIYTAIAQVGMLGFIPIDNQRRAQREHAIDLNLE